MNLVLDTKEYIAWPEELTRTIKRKVAHRKENWTVSMELLRQVLMKLGVTSAKLYYDQGSVKVEDPGIVVAFRHDGTTFIYAYDKYMRPEHNLMAIVEVLQSQWIQMKYGMVIIKQNN